MKLKEKRIKIWKTIQSLDYIILQLKILKIKNNNYIDFIITELYFCRLRLKRELRYIKPKCIYCINFQFYKDLGNGKYKDYFCNYYNESIGNIFKCRMKK